MSDLETPSTQGQTPQSVAGFQLLNELQSTVDALSELGYLLRIIQHLLATSDHRHLQVFTDEVGPAVGRVQLTTSQLMATADLAAERWGVERAGTLGSVIDAAPTEVGAALATALAEARDLRGEIEADGEMAAVLAERAASTISERLARLETVPRGLTYSS